MQGGLRTAEKPKTFRLNAELEGLINTPTELADALRAVAEQVETQGIAVSVSGNVTAGSSAVGTWHLSS